MLGDPVREIAVAREILRAVGLRTPELEVISCPTCGRCKVDLEAYVGRVRFGLSGFNPPNPIKVAVMGCEVNGPGEAKECDYGLACGPRNGILFAGGATLGKVPIEGAVGALIDKITGDCK
jgi:(E)-4-hydroxy-3-methylbut-2-enyl-diphosphate synthase